MKANLMLHAGARRVEIEQLAAVVTPDRTDTWVPIQHDRLLTSVRETLNRSGLRIVTEAHALAKNGSRYFGLLQVQNGEANREFGLVVGIRNSHDKSFPAGLVCGASVFVCDNLSFSGEVKLARKHTVHVERDLPQLVERAVGKLADMRGYQETRFTAYKAAEFNDAAAHDLIIRAVDARVVPVTKIVEVLQQWREPEFPEFAADGKTGWRLFNAFTSILRGNVTELPKRSMALHSLMDVACLVHPNETQLVQAV